MNDKTIIRKVLTNTVKNVIAFWKILKLRKFKNSQKFVYDYTIAAMAYMREFLAWFQIGYSKIALFS